MVMLAHNGKECRTARERVAKGGKNVVSAFVPTSDFVPSRSNRLKMVRVPSGSSAEDSGIRQRRRQRRRQRPDDAHAKNSSWRDAHVRVVFTGVTLDTPPPAQGRRYDVYVDRLHGVDDGAQRALDNAVRANGAPWRVLRLEKAPVAAHLMTPEAHFYGAVAHGVLMEPHVLRLTTPSGAPLPEASPRLYPVARVWVPVTAAAYAACRAAGGEVTVWLEPDADRVGPDTPPHRYVYGLLPLTGRPGSTESNDPTNGGRRFQLRVLECHRRCCMPSGYVTPYALFGAVLKPMIVQPPTTLYVGRHTAPGNLPTNLAVRFARSRLLHVSTNTTFVRPGCDFAVAGREVRVEALTPSGFYARELEAVPPPSNSLRTPLAR